MTFNVLDVFVNCPFDDAYTPIFNSIIYTVIRFGYRARCALEADDASENRFGKICEIIGQCRFGIHDISRTEVDGDPPLPRFNMPLELGLFLGAKRFGNRVQKDKICIVFDRERFRFQRFISDIAGQDIHAHGGDWRTLVKELSTWLRAQPNNNSAGGGVALVKEYEAFERALPAICATRNIEPDELSFSDFNGIVTEYVAALRGMPAGGV